MAFPRTIAAIDRMCECMRGIKHLERADHENVCDAHAAARI
jgi:hypothetical protein